MFRKMVIASILIFCLALSAAAFAEGLKVGVINFRKAAFECKKAKALQKELDTKQEDAKTQLDKMAGELRKLRDELDLLSEKAKEAKQAELTEKSEELNKFRRAKSEELVRLRDTRMRGISDEVISATGSFAEKNGYDIICDQMACVYFSKKHDITEKILAELDK